MTFKEKLIAYLKTWFQDPKHKDKELTNFGWMERPKRGQP